MIQNQHIQVQVENIEICACDFQELRENEKRGGARVFLFLPVVKCCSITKCRCLQNQIFISRERMLL